MRATLLGQALAERADQRVEPHRLQLGELFLGEDPARRGLKPGLGHVAALAEHFPMSIERVEFVGQLARAFAGPQEHNPVRLEGEMENRNCFLLRVRL